LFYKFVLFIKTYHLRLTLHIMYRDAHTHRKPVIAFWQRYRALLPGGQLLPAIEVLYQTCNDSLLHGSRRYLAVIQLALIAIPRYSSQVSLIKTNR